MAKTSQSNRAALLKRLREKQGLSLQELSFRLRSRKCPISSATLSRYEKSGRVLAKFAHALAEFYRIDVARLWTPR